MLLIAFVVLLSALAMKIIARTSDSRSVFILAVLGFIAIYILAAIAITWLNPGLPGANVKSFSALIEPAPTTNTTVQDVIIRE